MATDGSPRPDDAKKWLRGSASYADTPFGDATARSPAPIALPPHAKKCQPTPLRFVSNQPVPYRAAAAFRLTDMVIPANSTTHER